MEKSFAQLKRDLQVGTKLKCIYNLHGKNLNTIRTINKRQTNGLYLETKILDKGTFSSWLMFPKKAEQVLYENNNFRFYETINNTKTLVLEYEIIKED